MNNFLQFHCPNCRCYHTGRVSTRKNSFQDQFIYVWFIETCILNLIYFWSIISLFLAKVYPSGWLSWNIFLHSFINEFLKNFPPNPKYILRRFRFFKNFQLFLKIHKKFTKFSWKFSKKISKIPSHQANFSQLLTPTLNISQAVCSQNLKSSLLQQNSLNKPQLGFNFQPERLLFASSE